MVKRSRYRPGVGQRVGRSIALLFHDRGTRRGWVVSSTPRPHFTPGKDPVLISQEAGWAPGPAWTGGKSRPHRDSIPDLPARSQSLYWLSYPAHNSTYVSRMYWSHEGGIFRVFKSWEISSLHLRCAVVLYLNWSHVSKLFRHTCKAISHMNKMSQRWPDLSKPSQCLTHLCHLKKKMRNNRKYQNLSWPARPERRRKTEVLQCLPAVRLRVAVRRVKQPARRMLRPLFRRHSCVSPRQTPCLCGSNQILKIKYHGTCTWRCCCMRRRVLCMWRCQKVIISLKSMVRIVYKSYFYAHLYSGSQGTAVRFEFCWHSDLFCGFFCIIIIIIIIIKGSASVV